MSESYIVNPSAGHKAKKQLKSAANKAADLWYSVNRIDSPHSRQILNIIEELQTAISKARDYAETGIVGTCDDLHCNRPAIGSVAGIKVCEIHYGGRG